MVDCFQHNKCLSQRAMGEVKTHTRTRTQLKLLMEPPSMFL